MPGKIWDDFAPREKRRDLNRNIPNSNCPPIRTWWGHIVAIGFLLFFEVVCRFSDMQEFRKRKRK